MPPLHRTIPTAPLDAAAVERLRNLRTTGGQPLICDLARIFAREAPARTLSLEQAAQAGDTVAVSRVAHALKSSAAAVGAMRLHQQCGDLEELARVGPSSDAAIREAVLAVIAEVPLVCAALEREASGPPA